MWEYVQADLHVDGLEGLGQKLLKCLRNLKQKAADCPIRQKLTKQIIKLLKTIEQTKKVWNVNESEYEAWWN